MKIIHNRSFLCRSSKLCKRSRSIYTFDYAMHKVVVFLTHMNVIKMAYSSSYSNTKSVIHSNSLIVIQKDND